jgi:hypothetical protein
MRGRFGSGYSRRRGVVEIDVSRDLSPWMGKKKMTMMIRFY